MLLPVILLISALVGVVVALTVPDLSDGVLLAGPAALAAAWLLLAAGFRPRRGAERQIATWIVVDGSNVMHWKEGTPQIGTVREVVDDLTRRGFTPGVIFDANAGYKLSGRYLHDGALGRALGLPRSRIMVVPKGTPADPFVLSAARDFGARIVSNDRFRDWSETHPEIAEPGHLIRGGYRAGDLWLDID